MRNDDLHALIAELRWTQALKRQTLGTHLIGHDLTLVRLFGFFAATNQKWHGELFNDSIFEIIIKQPAH